MSRAEASRKSARRVAGFPGGLAQQVRQASRVEEPLGDSQESESESASETGAQGGRAVKLDKLGLSGGCCHGVLLYLL